jgi:hypothetical protein
LCLSVEGVESLRALPGDDAHDPAERKAFLAAKKRLLARITGQPHTAAQGGDV